MAFIYSNWRTAAASVVAFLMIWGAFILAREGSAPPIAQAATESALLSQIASRDSTGDGLPDWEKPLYGIPLDATTTDYFHLGMTDGEAIAKGLIVPKAIASLPAASSTPIANADAPAGAPAGTLTAAFAEDFFTAYLAAKQANGGANLTSAQMSALAQSSLAKLEASVSPAPDFKSASALTQGQSGAAALTQFAADAQAVFAAHGTQLPESELQYLQDYLNGDSSALAHISTLATAYTSVAVGLAALPVPPELAGNDLALINAMARVGAATADFARVDSDPVASMLALDQYGQAVIAMGKAFQAISGIYSATGVTLAPGAAGADFVGAMKSVSTTAP